MAAVLAGGEGAALSHRSAAALWGIGTELIDLATELEDHPLERAVTQADAPKRLDRESCASCSLHADEAVSGA